MIGSYSCTSVYRNSYILFDDGIDEMTRDDGSFEKSLRRHVDRLRESPIRPLCGIYKSAPRWRKSASRGNSKGVFGRKNLQDFKKAYFVLSTRKT